MDDPQRAAVYAAEDDVVGTIGRRLKRWVDVEAFLEQVVMSDAYADRFPDAPLDVGLDQPFAIGDRVLALIDHDVILIRDGSWNVLTVLHELAHLIAADPEPHGPIFVRTELALVRDHCGIEAYAELRAAFEAHAVRM